MAPTNRREFLDRVGRGMLVAGLGAGLAKDFGVSTAFADQGPDALSFGEFDALVDLLQSTPIDRLQPILVQKLKSGETDLRKLIAAAALANAETFGGQDYVGFHTAMAMLPALHMTELLPAARRPLPVLKVLYRNSQQIQDLGGASKKTLLAMHLAEHSPEGDIGLEIRDAARKANMQRAEDLFASLSQASLEQAFDALQPAVQDDVNVHRYVFAHRTYGLAQLLGSEFAYTLLRQCVRFCVDHEQSRIRNGGSEPAIRGVLPKLFDHYKLEGKSLGKRDPGDDWVDRTSRAIYEGPPERSADVVAAAFAEGIDPEVIGEAISLASNLLVLRQGADMPRCHGDSRGVHSSDATNAWRNIARVTKPRHAIAGLIVAAFHSAAHAPFPTEAYPTAEHLAKIKATDAMGLLDEADDAIRHNDQGRAAAAIQIYGQRGYAVDAIFDRMLKFTISEDGRLHGEKYFHTVKEEFQATRRAFRWRQIVGLARVTASAYGFDRKDQSGHRAPGYEEACRLLAVPS
jgi:hypothetical protein